MAEKIGDQEKKIKNYANNDEGERKMRDNVGEVRGRGDRMCVNGRASQGRTWAVAPQRKVFSLNTQ
jgi:hypothetical protein